MSVFQSDRGQRLGGLIDSPSPHSVGESQNTPAARAFEGGHLRLYEKLANAEGSALYQVRRIRKKWGLKGFYLDERYLGLLLLLIHAYEEIKPQPTYSRGAPTIDPEIYWRLDA